MGLREIVGATMTVFILVYFFWFVYPGLKTSYTNLLPALNMTSPVMQTLKPIADSWFLFLPMIIAAVGGYTIYLYATRYMGQDE